MSLTERVIGPLPAAGSLLAVRPEPTPRLLGRTDADSRYGRSAGWRGSAGRTGRGQRGRRVRRRFPRASGVVVVGGSRLALPSAAACGLHRNAPVRGRGRERPVILGRGSVRTFANGGRYTLGYTFRPLSLS